MTKQSLMQIATVNHAITLAICVNVVVVRREINPPSCADTDQSVDQFREEAYDFVCQSRRRVADQPAGG